MFGDSLKTMANTTDEEQIIVVLVMILNNVRIFMILFMYLYNQSTTRRLRSSTTEISSYSMIERAPDQRKHMVELVGLSDVTSLDAIRMNRDTFKRLCYLLEHFGGLTTSRHVDIPEQVAMFLNILAHHTKNVMIRKAFKRSTWTISKHFHRVLIAVIRMGSVLLVTPKPATHDNANPRWNFFQVIHLYQLYVFTTIARFDEYIPLIT